MRAFLHDEPRTSSSGVHAEGDVEESGRGVSREFGTIPHRALCIPANPLAITILTIQGGTTGIDN